MAEPGWHEWGSGEVLVAGSTEGDLLVLDEPLSFWGGVSEDGRIVDGHHPQVGASIAGTALLMYAVRGSSSSTSTLLECIRADSAPAVLLLVDPDPILVIAAVVAQELYGRAPTVLHLPVVPEVLSVERLRVEPDGRLLVMRNEHAVAR